MTNSNPPYVWKKAYKFCFTILTKNNIQKKKKNHLIHSKSKHIYCILLISYYFIYIYIYIYAFNNTLVLHYMNLLYNLKLKYLIIFIIYYII